MRTIEENMKRRIDMPIGSRKLIKKLVLIQQNTNRLILPLVIEGENKGLKRHDKNFNEFLQQFSLKIELSIMKFFENSTKLLNDI